MSVPIYVLVGASCSGKTWVAHRLADLYNYVPHDDYPISQYADHLIKQSTLSLLPIIADLPFRATERLERLYGRGADIHVIYFTESDQTLKERYEKREGKPIYKQHLTNNRKYTARASQGEFSGTAVQILHYLEGVAKRAS